MQERDTFDAQGFVVVNGFLDPSTLQTLTQLVERVYQIWRRKHRSTVIAENLVNMHSLTRREYFSERGDERIRFFEVVATPQLTTLVDALFGDGIYFHNTQLFFNPADRSKAPAWHRDLQYSELADDVLALQQAELLTLHVRVPLMTETGLEVVPGTHRRWDSPLERNVRLGIAGHSSTAPLPTGLLIPLQPGDIVIFHGQMIHRGHYASVLERKALDICIGRPHPFTKPFLDARVLPSAEEMDRIRNNHWYRRARALAAEEATASDSVRTGS